MGFGKRPEELTPEQIAQKEKNHAELMAYIRYKLSMKGISEWRKIGPPVEMHDRDVMGCSIKTKILEDGLYERINVDGTTGEYEINIKDGKAYPIPAPRLDSVGNLASIKEYKKAYRAVIDCLVTGQGAKTIEIEFPKVPGNSDTTQLKTLMMLVAEQRDVKVSFGPNATAFINKLGKQKKIEKSAIQHQEDYQLEKSFVFEHDVKALSTQERIPTKADDFPSKPADAAALKLAQDAWLSEKLFGKPGSPDELKGDARVKKMEEHLALLEHRFKQVEAYLNEVNLNLNTSQDMIKAAEKDASINLDRLEEMRKHNEASRNKLLSALETECKDLALRSEILEGLLPAPITKENSDLIEKIQVTGLKKIEADIASARKAADLLANEIKEAKKIQDASGKQPEEQELPPLNRRS